MQTANKTEATLDVHHVRTLVSEALNRLGALLMARLSTATTNNGEVPTDAVTAELQSRVGKLGQIAAGLAVVDAECLPLEGAGYGSLVVVRDVATGAVDEYMLMVGSLVDIDANQVSLASPIGQALLGKQAGDEITITTPYKQSRLLITRVVTLLEALDADDEDATRQ